ncbi:protein CYSTEINE-RICH TRANSMEMBRANE MODULE 9-like [Cannabis sativa]|uniref:protein CYSTEINE-RICH TRANSMEMBRANE MODULE 9-like n=1 Tax=Cannabis sativa TaxID=3483 RepID=UPI0029CA6800|nr:protein CYSTEINE-RICH TRANSMEMBRANE MODULE 9-like [Cannabis sativa]
MYEKSSFFISKFHNLTSNPFSSSQHHHLHQSPNMSSAQPSVSCYSAGEGPYVAPPPVGYPTMDASAVAQPQNRVETNSKDGLSKASCAAKCCIACMECFAGLSS